MEACRPLRNKNNPRVRIGRPCVRASADAVETPLNNVKKSKKALKLLSSLLMNIENTPGGSKPCAASRLDRGSGPEVAGLLPSGCLSPYERRFVLVFAHFSDGKDLPMHDHEHTRREQTRCKQALGEILQGIAAFKSQWSHCAGED